MITFVPRATSTQFGVVSNRITGTASLGEGRTIIPPVVKAGSMGLAAAEPTVLVGWCSGFFGSLWALTVILSSEVLLFLMIREPEECSGARHELLVIFPHF